MAPCSKRPAWMRSQLALSKTVALVLIAMGFPRVGPLAQLLNVLRGPACTANKARDV